MMNSPEPAQNFEATRRQHLIDATIEALADVGFKATSLSQIARRADVSTGLFAHYFGDKDGLLEATLRFMAARLVRATRQRLRAATTARERLYAVPDSALADQEFERRTSAVWLAFWGQITHSTRYQRIQRIYQRRMLSNLRHDLRPLVPKDCVEIYATMIASMIDGVWIRSHASVTQADGAHARSIVRALIDGLIVGVHDARPADVSETTMATPSPVKAKSKPTSPPFTIRPIPPASGPRLKLVSPVTHERLGVFPAARDLEIRTAFEKARSGLAAWHDMTGADRETRLRRCAEAIWADGDELARLTAISTGRPVAQTKQSGLSLATRAFARYSGLASRPLSERVALGAGSFGYTRHEPVGVVSGFGHWSAPLLDPCRQAAPALAFGNAIIFQSSLEGTPTALRLRDLFEKAGLPAGAFTVVTGDADTTRLVLAQSDDRGPAPREILPKSATIIFADADMEAAATAVLQGGRRWMPTPDLSENRVFVQRRGATAFQTRLAALAKQLRMGDPCDPTMAIGTLVSSVHLQHVMSLIGHAIGDGARCLVGGRGSGSFLAPSILDSCTDDMTIVRESVFAPVVTIITFDDDEEIVRLIGRQDPTAPAAIFCADVGHGHRIANRLRTIFCCINDSALTVSSDFDGDVDPSFDGWTSGRYGHSKRVFCRDRRCLDV